MFMPSLYPPIKADSIAGAGEKARPPGRGAGEDGRATSTPRCAKGTSTTPTSTTATPKGSSPPKSHWARRIDPPPFYAYPVRPGITFTYLGTRVDRDARMQMAGGGAARNMFAAGEIMSGNVLGQGYAAGIGMTIGSVFGRIAGERAAQNARDQSA